MKRIRKDLCKNYLLKLAFIVIFLILDLITKHFFYRIKTTSIIPYILGLRDAGVLNTGGAWGIFENATWLLIVFTFVFLLVMLLIEIFRPTTHPLYLVSFSLIMGGTIGNLIDRLALGGVRDFIYFEFMPDFPTFNFADSCLCIGVVLLLIYVLFIYHKENKNQKLPKTSKDESGNI